MASSVSSERAFSSSALTITKHRNHLRGDVVEAIQVSKSIIKNDSLMWERGPTLEDEASEDSDSDSDSEGEENSWEIETADSDAEED